MLGKIYFKNKWTLCRFENNILDILHHTCDAPWVAKDNDIRSKGLIVSMFEDGHVYFFDLSGNFDEIKDEYVQFRFTGPNFFKSTRYTPKGEYTIKTFERVTFKNGILMPMITLSQIPKFDIKIDELNIQIEFCASVVEDDVLCKMKYGTMLSSYPTKKVEYSVTVTFPCAVELLMLNKIIKKIYKIIQFISTDYCAPIENLIVKTNIGELTYHNNDVCLTNKAIINRFNYIGNCDNIKELSQFIVEEKCDIGFLALLDKEDFNEGDYWTLGKSLETNVDNDIDNYVQNVDFREEISIHTKLREEIQDTIVKFEEQNKIKLAENKKSFILSAVAIPYFRRKAVFALEKYNNFAKVYSKYKKFDDTILNEFSRHLAFARNTIHGEQKIKANEDIAELAATICILGLYIHILEQGGSSCSCIFNLVQCLGCDALIN